MKKSPLRLLGVTVLLTFAAACAPTTPSSGEEAPPPPAETTPTSMPSPTEPPPTPAPALDFNAELPLDDLSASIAAPDFLTEEQQNLYRRAHCLYLNLFGSASACVDRLGDEQNGFSNETVVIDDMTYTLSNGRYRNWADFDVLVHAVFTEKFWDEHNNPVSAIGEPWTIFREYNGSLCYLDTEKGQGYYYNRNFPDEFRLESQSENRILFTLIGHYSWVWPKEGETFEERDARRTREYEYTIEFPIRMVLTGDGWRFDEFHSALVDEDFSPQGRIVEGDKVSYVDERLGIAIEFPESWRGKLEVERRYGISWGGWGGGHCITFYHKPTRESCSGGVLFMLDCCPGLRAEDEPAIMAGSSILVLQTDQYTVFFRTPSDVQWHEKDEALEREYKAFMADFEFVRAHITPIE